MCGGAGGLRGGHDCICDDCEAMGCPNFPSLSNDDDCRIHGRTDEGFCEGCFDDNEREARDAAWMLDSSEGDR